MALFLLTWFTVEEIHYTSGRHVHLSDILEWLVENHFVPDSKKLHNLLHQLLQKRNLLLKYFTFSQESTGGSKINPWDSCAVRCRMVIGSHFVLIGLGVNWISSVKKLLTTFLERIRPLNILRWWILHSAKTRFTATCNLVTVCFGTLVFSSV